MQKISIKQFTKEVTQLSRPATNHIFCVDCSGSMYDSLPSLRKYLKSNLSLMVKPNDTVSIIYFSSKGQYGVVFENQTINDLNDLNKLQKSIELLKPMCCTGFKEPIVEAIEMTKRLSSSKLNNFIFMTDGYDNEWGSSEILGACAKLPSVFSEITFIEYGWYCNRKLLEQMAEKSNGLLVFSENYAECETTIEKSITSENVKKVLYTDVVNGQKVIYFKNEEVVILDVKDNQVLIPENLNKIIIVPQDYTLEDTDEEVQYTLLYNEINRAKTNEAWKILKVLGDVKIINAYGSCFSKQDYSNVLSMVKDCIFKPSTRHSEGKDTTLVPKEDAYTVIDLLNELVEGDNKLMITSPHFQYSRIGAKTEAKSAMDKISELQEQMKNTTSVAEIQEIAKQISEIQETVEFTAENLDKGVDIGNIVWNENRPNISINTTQVGYVTLPSNKAKEFNLPEKFPTQIFRTYTIVKDGIKNVKVLPIKLCEETFKSLKAKELVGGQYDENEIYLIDINKIPVINRVMVKELSAKVFTETYFELQDKKAKQKVLKHLLDDKEKAIGKMIEVYGEEAAKYLESIGVKDYGFSPKVTTVKGEDVYLSKELNVKISGLSSLPSINAVMKKGEGKLNLADSLIKRYLDIFEPHKDNKALLTTETENCIKEVRKLQKSYNQTMYGIIIGQVWFKEFASIDENTLSMNFGEFKDVKCQIILEEKEVTI